MCTHYISPSLKDIVRQWDIQDEESFLLTWAPSMYPRAPGPFIRSSSAGRELVVGQWGLIPFFAREAKLPYSTNNARAEELAAKPTFRESWKRGQRCIIPAASFDEPNWESGKNIWWSFRRKDRTQWGLAGLWNTWADTATGEVIESFTMLTMNADEHPLMRRMHKPKPNVPASNQDKRSVVSIEMGDVDQWLLGTPDEARSLLKLAPLEIFDAGPAQQESAPRQR